MRLSNLGWKLIIVYGPTDHSLSNDFIQELEDICDMVSLPLVVGGDFNLIRNANDKNNDNIDKRQKDLFNGFVGKF